MLPGNHLVRAQPMSAADYKPLTATLDPFFRILRSNLFILFFYIPLISCQLNVCQEADLSLL